MRGFFFVERSFTYVNVRKHLNLSKTWSSFQKFYISSFWIFKCLLIVIQITFNQNSFFIKVEFPKSIKSNSFTLAATPFWTKNSVCSKWTLFKILFKMFKVLLCPSSPNSSPILIGALKWSPFTSRGFKVTGCQSLKPIKTICICIENGGTRFKHPLDHL